jgi:tetratricopeptide (TPR) repeat protein
VARLLDRTPAKRPQQAADVARELLEISAEVGVALPVRPIVRGRELPEAASARGRGAAVPEHEAASPAAPALGGHRAQEFHDLREAGLAALRARDHASARDHLDRALELVDGLDEEARQPARIECTELLADALVVVGDAGRGVELLRTLAPLAAPPATRVRWLRKLGMARLRTADVAGGLATLEQGLAVLGHALPRRRLGLLWRIVRDGVLMLGRRALRRAPARDPAGEELATIHRELAMMHRWIDLDRSAAHLVAFVRLAHRLGVDAYLIDAYAGTGFLQAMRSWSVLAARNHDRARKLALGAGDMQRLARLELVCGATEVVLSGDEEAACSHLDRGVELAETVGDRFLESFALSMRGSGAALLGRWRQAADDFGRAAALAAELEVPWLESDAACGRGAVELLFGRFEEASRAARRVLGSDERMVLPAFEALALEVLALEALLQGRFRDAVAHFDRARSAYAAHHLYRGWGVLTKVAHCEAALCLADEQGAQAVPDLLARLRRGARYSHRRLKHVPLHRGHDLLLRGVYEARRGNARAARRLFARLRAVRAGARPGLMDLWIEVRLAFERRRLGEPREEVAAELDELARTYDAAGLFGICSWLSRMREVHSI